MAGEQAVVSVADLLLRHGLVTREQLNEANRRKREQDKTLGLALLEMGVINEAQKLALYKKHFGMEVVSLADFQVEPQDMAILPRSFCERNCLVPVMRDRGSLVVAVEDPTNILMLDEAASLSSMTIHPVIASCSDIVAALKHYPEKRPEDEEQDAADRRRLSKRLLIHDIAFAIVMLLPILIFFLLLAEVKQVQNYFIAELERYEQILVFFLSWALWAVTAYEVDGLIWSRSRQLK